MIRANHFLVNVADNNLFHYDVSINPESKSRAVNREVLSELIKLHGKTSLGGKLPAYDGRKSLYTAGSLPFESEEFSVTLVDPEKKDKERAEREYKITIRIAGRTDLYHLQQFLKGRQRDMPQETIQVLDVVLRESPSWNYVTVSRSFFSTTFGHRGDIGEGLECWRGYYQSLRPTQMGLSLNIDISATSFFKPVTVVQFVLEFLNLRDASRPLTDRDRVKIKKALRGVRVETNHQEDQIRRYKITGITPIPMSQLIFPVDERGTRMSVVQYFMQRYNYNLQYTSWPCLQSGSNARPVYLPMEACKIVEGQRYSKKLNDKQVTNILRATCQRPQQREQSIREMVLHNKYAEDKFAQEFGINVCSDLVSVPARVLPPPMLRYHDSGKVKTCAPSVGQWNMINKFVNPRSLVHNGSVLERAFVRNGTPFVSEVPTIIFGADVTHPPPGEDSASSIASVVASMDWPAITKYRGLVSAQPHRQEIIEDLFSVTKDPQRGNVNGGMIRELLIAFRRKTGRRPERIIYYRDGVSEGQFSHVLLHEMDAIRKACASLEEGYMPPVTFVIVRHHIRLDIPKFHGRCDTSDKSGTILTETLADETKYVFSLCKDADIQGTSRPTHYHVLYDENHYTADALQSLTNNLCYTSVRCTRATSVVLPAYYAHVRAVICARYNVEGDSLDGGSTPRSSGQAAITREGHVEVRQVPKIKENVKDLPGGDSPGIKWRGTNIFIDTPVGRMTVDVPLKNSCYSLKIAIEKKLGVSIDRCTLKTSCGIPIEYNHTLEYYGLKNLSVLSMGVKLLGGADMYEIEAETLHEYANDSARFFDTEVIPHITRPNEWQQVELMNKIGRGIGRDVTGTFMKAAQEKLSWGGQIELTDFIVVDDQVILRKQPTEELTESNFSLDCGQLRSFMVQIFNAQQKKVFFMDDFLDTLQVAQRSSISWLIPYLTTHYVFKTPLERGNTSCNLFGFFEDLSDEIKESFRNDLRFIFCFDWTSMKCQLSYLFQPTLHYHKKGKPKANYSSRGFGPFHFQRNFNMHSNVMAPHLKDVAIALLMGDYMCRVIRHLLMKGWYIHKIIGA